MNLFEEALNINAKEEILKELNKLKLNDEEQLRLNEELNHLNEINADIIYLLKLIKDYAKEKNQYIFYRGCIYNSYICYLLNITDINPLDKTYYLYNEFLYDNNGIIDADVSVSDSFRNDLANYLKKLLNGNFLKGLVESDDKTSVHPTKYVVLLNDKKEYKYYKNEKMALYHKMDFNDYINVDLCIVPNIDKISLCIKEYGYPKDDLFNNKEIFHSIFKLENLDYLVLYSFLNKYVLKKRKEKLLKDDNSYNILDYYLTAYGEEIENEDEKFDIYCKLFPKTRDQLMKLLIDKNIERTKAYEMAITIAKGKNINYKKWKDTINEIYDILEVDTGMYLELTNYLPPLGHVVAYVKYDALIEYYKIIEEHM